MGRIGEALEGRTLLITGSTGFLAKALVEKLLRDVPGIRRMYLLIRSRSGGNGTRLSAEDRLSRDVLSSAAFDRLRRKHGDDWSRFVSDRVEVVAGDLTSDRLGIEQEKYEALSREVDTVVNSAATVSFDERLDWAIETNTLGPRRLLAFADQCRSHSRLPVLYLHVSTAYVSGWREGGLPERPFHPGDTIRALRGEPDAPPLDLDAEVQACREAVRRIEAESLDEARLSIFRRRAWKGMPRGCDEGRIRQRAELFRQQWVKDQLVDLGMERAQHYGWNDTYTFTKAMGEMVVVRERGDVPTLIVRPSIIESSMDEPTPGWLDGFRMADPIIMGYGKGVLTDIPARPETVVDLVPLDYVVNSIVAAMAEPIANSQPLKVFQVATGAVSPLSFRMIYELSRDYFQRNPMVDREGDPIAVSECSYPTPEVFARRMRLRYLFPLRVASWVADKSPLVSRRLRARIATRKSAVEQALYYNEIYGPYLNLSYAFDVSSTLALYAGMSQGDKKLFPFDMRTIDWRHYIQDIHIPGLKLNVLKLGSANGRRIQRSTIEAELELSEWAGTEQETLYDVLRFVAERYGDQVALEMGRRKGKPEAYTYQQLFEAGGAAAERFAAHGVARGDRIVLYAENSPRWGVAYLAAAGSGITVVPLDPQTTPEELERVARFTDSALIVASEATFRRLGDGSSIPSVLVLNIDRDLEPFDGTGRSPRPPKTCTWGKAEPDDASSIIFTSGTTVDPKAVLLTHRNFLADAMAVGKVLRPYPTDRFLSVLPLHHVFEFTGGFLMPLWGGAKITYVEAIKSRVILETMRRTRTTCMLAVPRLFEILHDAIFKQVASLPFPSRWAFRTKLGLAKAWRFVTGRSAGRFFLRELHQRFGGHVRLLVSGGAALDPELCDSFALMGFPLCEGYGLTETAPVLTVNPLRRSKPGSVGRPLPGVELRIDDSDENGVGEIVVRGEMLMQGYLRNPDATDRMLRHGWLHTGDLGYQDPDGYLFITGRSRDLIVTAAGKNVYPNEVEALYRKSLPDLSEICVVGIRSPGRHGEEVHAVVVPTRNRLSSPEEMDSWRAEVQEAIRAASEFLPTYQRIQKVHFWKEELPKTSNLAKVQRHRVRDAIAEGRQEEVAPAAEPARELEILPRPLSKTDFDRLVRVLATITKVPRSEITHGAQLQFDLGMDSLMKVELLAVLEESFHLRIPDGLAAELTTVEDVTEMIATRRDSERGDSRTAYWDRVLAGPTAEGAAVDPGAGWISAIGRRTFRWTGGVIYRRYFGIQVEGTENVPEDGACIFVANHSSHLDSGAVLVALGGRGSGLRLVAARDYFFSTTIRGWFFRHVFNAIPFDRRERFIDGLRICRAALDRGERLLIFPEGTRSVTGELQPFKPGIGVLAVNLGVPVIPTRIRGTYEALPKGSLWPHHGRIRVTFGEPMIFSGPRGDSSYEQYREVAADLCRRVEGIP